MMRTLILFLSGLLMSAPAVAATPVGEMHRATTLPSASLRDAGHKPDLRVTIWYPAAPGSREEPILIGPDAHPIFRIGMAAMDAQPAEEVGKARRPLILLSHGYGGSARVMGWFGIEMARRGYIVAAVDHPGNNGADPMTVPGALLFWERPLDLRAALDLVLADKLIGPHVDPSRIGVAGFSAGGYTALAAGGARTDPSRFLEFCAAHPEDGVCRPQIEFPITAEQRDALIKDPAYSGSFAHAGDDRTIPHLRAVYAMAPALVQAMVPDSLRDIAIPVRIIAGNADTIVPPMTNAEPAASLIPHAKLTILPNVTHYDFLADCVSKEIPLCGLAQHQAQAHAAAIDEATKLFAEAFAEKR